MSRGFATEPEDLLGPPLVVSMLWSLVVLVPTLAVRVRRLHDANWSGWCYLLAVPGYIGVALQLWAVGSFDPERIALEGPSVANLGPMLTSGAAAWLSLPASIILLVFLALAPHPLGRRFDRRP